MPSHSWTQLERIRKRLEKIIKDDESLNEFELQCARSAMEMAKLREQLSGIFVGVE